MSELYRERESKLIEFKSKVPPKFDSLIKTCIAFANAAGGRIIIGVDDKSHEVIGVKDDDRTRIYDDFPSSLYDLTQPSLIAQIYEKNHGADSVLIIEIPASPRKPYFLKNKGIKAGTYIRVGSSTRLATQEYIEDLTREALRVNFDEETVNADIGILSKDLIADFIETKVTKRRLQAEKIIARMPANTDEFKPTVAGVLMFSNEPHNYIPEALVRCTRFKGVEGRDIVITSDITGPIEKQAQESVNIIKTWVRSDFELSGAKYKGKLPLPEEAIREAISNALLHRKYNIPGATKIAVYDNRIEVFNPGDFPGPVDINILGDGTTFLRNPNLVRLAYKLHLIDSRGTGIQLIFDSCKKAGIRKPEYHDEGDFVKVIFYFEPDTNSYPTEEDAIIAFIKLKGEVTAQQIAEYLSVSRNTAIRKLNLLIKAKKVKKSGKTHNVKYLIRTNT